MKPTQRERRGSDPRLFSATHRALVVGLLVLVASAAFSRLGVSTILPSATHALDGRDTYGAVLATFTLCNIVGLTTAGATFDRFGIRRPFYIAVGCFALGLVLAAAAPSMVMLITARALQGLGAGALAITAYTAIARGIPASRRPAMLALNASAFTIPSMIGPLAAGAIADASSWRLVFGILIPLAPLAALLLRSPLGRIENETAERDTSVPAVLARSTVVGCALFVVGVLIMLLAPSLTNAWMWGTVIVGLGLSLSGVAALMPRGTLLMLTGTPSHMMFAIGLSLAFFTTDLYLPLALAELRALSASTAGFVLTAGVLGWTAGAYIPSFGQRIHIGRRAPMVIGAVMVLLGICGAACSFVLDLHFSAVVACWAIAGFGAGAGFTANADAVLARAGDSPGEFSSQMELGNQAGIAIGTGIGGVLIAVGGVTGFTVTSVLVAACIGAVVALAAALRSTAS